MLYRLVEGFFIFLWNLLLLSHRYFKQIYYTFLGLNVAAFLFFLYLQFNLEGEKLFYARGVLVCEILIIYILSSMRKKMFEKKDYSEKEDDEDD